MYLFIYLGLFIEVLRSYNHKMPNGRIMCELDWMWDQAAVEYSKIILI